jgi:mono/diheme cytochrome c family protein
MKKVDLFRLLTIAASVCVTAWASAMSDEATLNSVTEFPDEGALLPGLMVYQKNCVMCHGKSGDGRGEMGLTVQPRPRDFRKGVFKFRSTPDGFLPRTEDLKRTVRTGLSGTAMPTFEKLPERDVRNVVEYIKTFSSRWQKAESFSAPIEIPRPPEWFADAEQRKAHLNKGKVLFATACASCHGESGDGQGPAAAQLQDSSGQPCTPSDLRQRTLRSGPEATDLYRVLATGLNGTPMPSFAEAFTPEQRWEIVAYVRSLQGGAQRTETPRTKTQGSSKSQDPNSSKRRR